MRLVAALVATGSTGLDMDDWVHGKSRCQQRDAACANATDMALVQWGYYLIRNGDFGLEDRNMTYVFALLAVAAAGPCN